MNLLRRLNDALHPTRKLQSRIICLEMRVEEMTKELWAIQQDRLRGTAHARLDAMEESMDDLKARMTILETNIT